MITLNVLGILAIGWLGGVEVAWDTAVLRLDDAGCLVALQDKTTSRNYAVPGGPFCRIETEERMLVPSATRKSGDRVSFDFAGGVSLTFAVTTGPGFSVWQLAGIDGMELARIRTIHLCALNLEGLSGVGSQINACYDESFSAAVMATQINVHCYPVAAGARGSNHQGVTHTFSPQAKQVREGQHAARFAATSSRGANDGWSMRGRALEPPLNLAGLQAVKAWVYGDGKGELLKVQLFDGKDGYRDDYIRIDFTGWREVTCDKPALDKIDRTRVSNLNFYYNGLQANSSVECLIDSVRAVVTTGQGEREAMLEDFEDPGSELWDARGVVLNAKAYQRHGITPAGFGVIACPRGSFEAAVDAFEKAAGLPNPHPGGTWSKRSPWTKQSYLFITSVAERDTDEVIEWAKRGGFFTILILGDSWSKSHGHYEINRDMFPDGLPSLQRAVEKMRQAGFRVGLHFLGAAVYLNDPYVWPKPDARLFKDAWAELAGDVDEKADFIPTAAAPQGFPAEDGAYLGQGTFIQIGDELVHYGEPRTEPPYGFAKCERAACRTVAAGHRKGDKIAHLLRSYGYFLYDLDTTLADEVIGNVCKVANAINADMLYFDGSERLQGEHWYYNAKLQSMYYERLRNKDIFLQGSSYSHYSWHLLSRTASADGHGDVKGYLDQRLSWFTSYATSLMPLDIGWYYVYDLEVTADQFEYILQKCLGFDASISVQTNPQRLRDHPEMGPIIDSVRVYDQLRLSGRVPEEVRKLLREPGREYRLLTNPLRLRRVVYGPWQEVRALDGKQNVWSIEPAMEGSRLGLQVRCGPMLEGAKAPATQNVPQLVEPALRIGEKRIVFPVTLAEGERLVYYPGQAPEIIPARQGPRRTLDQVQPVELIGPQSVTLTVKEPLAALAKVRLVQDCPEELLLPQDVVHPHGIDR